MTSPATHRCTACGREFPATSNYVRGGLPHCDDLGPVTRPCSGGSLELVGAALIDLAADMLAVALALCATFGGVRAVHVAPTIEVP